MFKYDSARYLNNWLDYRIQDKSIHDYNIYEYGNGNIKLTIHIHDYRIKVKLERYITISGVWKYLINNITTNSKDSWVNYNIKNIVFNMLVSYRFIHTEKSGFLIIGNNELVLTRKQIMQVHYLIEYLYNESGVTQARISNQNRNMSSEYQITRIQNKYATYIKPTISNKYMFDRDISFENLNPEQKYYFHNLLIQYKYIWFKD